MDDIRLKCFGSPAAECRRLCQSVACGNTVIIKVPQTDETWCLGFIEDIAGDELYISFHCTRVAARWFPSHLVFPHIVYSYPLREKNLLVALRTSKKDPFVLRAAVVLSWVGGGGLLCYVETIIGCTRHLVHHLQIVKQLPQRALHGATRRTGLYTRYSVKLPAAAPHGTAGRYSIQLRGWNRFYFHVDKDNVTIICWEFGDCFWTQQLLSLSVHRCLESDALRMDWQWPMLSKNGMTHLLECCYQAPDFLCIPLEVIALVFEYMDIITQTRLERVNPLWTDMLAASRKAAIVIDFGMRLETVYRSNEAFRLGIMLYHALKTHVHTLVMTKWTPGLNVYGHHQSSAESDIAVLCELLRIKGTKKLRRIVMHKCVVDYEFDLFRQCLLRCLSPLMDMCGHLILIDYVMDDALWPFAINRPCHNNKALLLRRQPPLKLELVVAYLRLDCSQHSAATYNEILSTILQALPEPSVGVRTTVASMLTYWHSLDLEARAGYWKHLREVLQFTQPLDSAKPAILQWVDVQFTSASMPYFTKLTLIGLHSMWYVRGSELRQVI
ncbi:uncharacterized protein LOC129583375 isoform X2 [Paramacrobiotus metropolitanus]|uniref:uncharacterized protein LOC129583375 isoform X2 n=1 Tax=Paramacrobiotus metropolitanus TaxID=2943436 RepID=UPI002445F430|nr:uncharacterized protein LOC129583375 isoform X2 [Paramacrobiotus metropolitanus]